MVFQIKTQLAQREDKFEFEGHVRQYAIGLSSYLLGLLDGVPQSDLDASKVVLKIINHRMDGDKVHYQIDLNGELSTCGAYVACIADVDVGAGESARDSCGVFVDGDGQGARLPDECRFAEKILTGFEREKQGDFWSGRDSHMFIAMAKAEGRTFAKSVNIANGRFSVDFRDVIGEGVKIQSAAVFLQEPGIVRLDESVSALGGGVWDFSFNGSEVYWNDAFEGKLLVVVHTEPVVVKHRGSVNLRLSGEDTYFWEWEVSDHWHPISRASDDLDWFKDTNLGTLAVRVGNNTTRPIQLTLDGDDWARVEPRSEAGDMAWSPTVNFQGRRKRQIWGNFADGAKEQLPDPTFVPIKQGG